MWVELSDGRELVLPLEFYPTLVEMTPRQRRQWSLIGNGTGVEWEEYDLQLSVRGFLEGRREHVPPPSFRRRFPRPVDIKRNTPQRRRALSVKK